MPQDIASAKAPVPVLGKGRMVWDLPIQAEPTKPAIREIKMNLLAQPALRPYSHAIADDQHADHQLRVDRGATGVAVVRLQRLTDGIEVKMPVDASQHVIGRDMLIEAEIIKQLGRRLLSAHHCRVPPDKSPEAVNHGSAATSINRASFSTISATSGLPWHDREPGIGVIRAGSKMGVMRLPSPRL